MGHQAVPRGERLDVAAAGHRLQIVAQIWPRQHQVPEPTEPRHLCSVRVGVVHVQIVTGICFGAEGFVHLECNQRHASARSSKERNRSRGSWVAVVTTSSSAPVTRWRFCNCSTTAAAPAAVVEPQLHVGALPGTGRQPYPGGGRERPGPPSPMAYGTDMSYLAWRSGRCPRHRPAELPWPATDSHRRGRCVLRTPPGTRQQAASQPERPAAGNWSPPDAMSLASVGRSLESARFEWLRSC